MSTFNKGRKEEEKILVNSKKEYIGPILAG
jgi:hypothetical protein